MPVLASAPRLVEGSSATAHSHYARGPCLLKKKLVNKHTAFFKCEGVYFPQIFLSRLGIGGIASLST